MWRWTSCVLNLITWLIHPDHWVFICGLFWGRFPLLLAGWYKDNSTDALHAWMCVIWYDRFCSRRSFSESSSFLPFIAVTGGVYVCACYTGMWVWVHVIGVWEDACVSVCVPCVLQCWRVEARVCLHSEISQISYCLCSFSIHALWFTTPRASYTNDAAFSEGFLPELKHAPLVTRTMMLLGLGDLTEGERQRNEILLLSRARLSLCSSSVLTRSH